MCADKTDFFFNVLKQHLKPICCSISMAQLAYVANFWNYCEAPWSATNVKKKEKKMSIQQLVPQSQPISPSNYQNPLTC